MAKSKIKKSISRTIQAKQFEPFTIHVEAEDEIEWESEEDRAKELR